MTSGAVVAAATISLVEGMRPQTTDENESVRAIRAAEQRLLTPAERLERAHVLCRDAAALAEAGAAARK
jgi:hypothetical protein